MKKIVYIILLAFVSSLAISSGDPYVDAMKTGMEMMGKAQNSDGFLSAANQFERISLVATDQWLPAYYAAYAKAIAASMSADPAVKEDLLDAAETFLKKASAVDHDPSEVGVLQGFIHLLRIAVDPGTRGQQYSGMSAASLQRAQSLNPDNPRALYMLAQLSYGTAQFFGSDTSEACQTNARAIELFRLSEEQKDVDPFAPKWGKSFAESFHQNCEN